MKKQINLLTYFCVLCTISAVLGVSAFAQSKTTTNLAFGLDEEPQTAPFDFSDSYYSVNGVQSDYIQDRRNGRDGYSVFDFSSNEMFQNVRITATLPAYDQDGSPYFYNLHGDLGVEGFNSDPVGKSLKSTAARSPIYMFPSEVYKGSDRQAPLFDTRNDGEEPNPLSIRMVCLVQFSLTNMTEEDEVFYQQLIAENGVSLDDTPIIRTVDDLMALLNRGLITIRMRGHGEFFVPAYAIVPIIDLPRWGAITEDAFLITVLNSSGKPLDNEGFFHDRFDCLKLNVMARRCYEIVR